VVFTSRRHGQIENLRRANQTFKKTIMLQNQTSQLQRVRVRIGLLALALSVLLAGCVDSAPSNPLRLADGSTTSPSQWQGDWVLINYWADWCGPCREEVPELNHLNASEEGFSVLGVNYDYLEGVELQASIDSLGIAFPTLIDDPQILLGYDEATVLPMSVLISPEGVLHRILVGPQTAETLLAAKAGPAQATSQL
jgi:thiol-disulfide isomerase/thioredoxin